MIILVKCVHHNLHSSTFVSPLLTTSLQFEQTCACQKVFVVRHGRSNSSGTGVNPMTFTRAVGVRGVACAMLMQLTWLKHSSWQRIPSVSLRHRLGAFVMAMFDAPSLPIQVACSDTSTTLHVPQIVLRNIPFFESQLERWNSGGCLAQLFARMNPSLPVALLHSIGTMSGVVNECVGVPVAQMS